MAKKRKTAKAELPAIVITVDYDEFKNILLTPGFLSTVPDMPQSGSSLARERFEVLWDTGASASSIDKRVVMKLALRPVDRVDAVSHAYGVEKDVNVYAVNFSLAPDQPGINIRVAEARLDHCDMLVGMDVISSGDFVVTRHKGKARMTFRAPSIGNFDFIEEFDKQVKRAGGKPNVTSRRERGQFRPRGR